MIIGERFKITAVLMIAFGVVCVVAGMGNGEEVDGEVVSVADTIDRDEGSHGAKEHC